MAKSHHELREDLNQSGFDFVMTDIETAMVFTRRALGPNVDPEVKRRNVANARKGYDTVVRLRGKLELDSGQQGAFDEKRAALKKMLLRLGERF